MSHDGGNYPTGFSFIGFSFLDSTIWVSVKFNSWYVVFPDQTKVVNRGTRVGPVSFDRRVGFSPTPSNVSDVRLDKGKVAPNGVPVVGLVLGKTGHGTISLWSA